MIFVSTARQVMAAGGTPKCQARVSIHVPSTLWADSGK
jgi:hypothetical protein